MKVKLVLADKVNFRERENFGDMTPEFMRYFRSGGCHFDEKKAPEERAVFIYTRVVTEWCEGCVFRDSKEDRITFSYSGFVPKIFYDIEPRTFDILKKCPYSIFVNEKFAGVFCRRYQSLVLTDWTHDSDCVIVAKEVFAKLMDVLKQRFGFAELPIKERLVKLDKVEVQIGTDPEFEELQDWDRYSPVPTSFYGTSNEIGADGAGNQVEIRPKPGKNHIELVRNIKSLISKVNVPLSVRGDRYPLGGHIHFGFPDARVRKIVKDNISCIVKVLDDFIGKPLLALSGTARGSYKRLGAYELKPWGFEYRTPPAAYLLSSDIARIVFKIARNTVKYFLEKGRITYQVDEKSGLPTFKDYMRIAKLSGREYFKFENFISEYCNIYLGEAINANWVKVKPEYQISIRFRDDWDSDIRCFVEEWLERKFKRSRIKRKKSIEVVLFGLRKERGEVVYGFNCKGFSRLPDDDFSCSSEFVFGVPARLRFMISESMNTSTAETAEESTAEEIMAEEVLEEILSEERKREAWVEETKKEWERVLRAIWKEIRNRIG